MGASVSVVLFSHDISFSWESSTDALESWAEMEEGCVLIEKTFL